ncbi:hypothetical protein [Pseudomonas izuensis]|uniref:Uncharacterized protein n=1 Tax=Pseudomonas izuensis TaxID=2684212 RepID=A0ABM7RNE8_9PSED|nr:hypothetical protein [Pseudomonas izuensis]BCX67224.1 hypothetical protein LAB08_R18580 [Pseudomonas izuensis]
MEDSIDDKIARLKHDSGMERFTGFVSYATVDQSELLSGHIWRHIDASTEGEFADGHKIITSPVLAIYGAKQSLWVETKTGSIYGILSLAPLGWLSISDLYKAHQRLESVPAHAPDFYLKRSSDPLPPMKNRTLKDKGRPHNTSALRPDGKGFLRSPITPAERNFINESIAQIRFNSQPTHPESQVDPSKTK